jgi:hypothetical protein
MNLFWVILFSLLIKNVANQELLPNDRCNHYPDRGTCETHFEVKWYYDRFDHRCRRFFYGGCDGNGNRFDSLEECEQTCRYDSNAGEEESSKRCFLSHDPGDCTGNFERWHFDANLGQCVCSWWSGCGGNANSRYYSFQHCMHVCGKYATNQPVDERTSFEPNSDERTPFRPASSKIQAHQNQWNAISDESYPNENLHSDETDYPFSIDANSNAADIFMRKRREQLAHESYETPFIKLRQTKKKSRRMKRKVRYEEYAETPAIIPPLLNLRPTPASRKNGVRYEEYAETPFRWPSYVETTTPGSRPLQPQANERQQESPRIPQEVLNRLIQQYLTKRPQFLQESTAPTTAITKPRLDGSPSEIQYTLYRRFPTNSSQLSYAEKRRRWKAEMKRRMKAAKIPPRPINPPGNRVDEQIPNQKGKYFITYSPYNRQYQISRQRPRIFDDADNQNRPVVQPILPTTTLQPITTRVSTTTRPLVTTPIKTTTTQTTFTRPVHTTTTTARPKILRLPAESVPDTKGAQLTVRVASIKPTFPPVKQIISLDDYDLSEEDEEDDNDAEQPNRQPPAPTRSNQYSQYERVQPSPYVLPTTPPIYRQTSPPNVPSTPAYIPAYEQPTPPPYKPNQIVYPVGNKPTETSHQANPPINRQVVVPPITTPRTAVHKRIEDVTNFFAPPPQSEDADYDDLGDSEEDLFFWKPDYEQKKGVDRARVPGQDQSVQQYNEETAIQDDPFKIEVHEAV